MTMPDEDRVPYEHLKPEERDLEAPPEDAAEQALPVDPDVPDDEPVRILYEVSEWDAVEQSRVVDIEDEYR